MTRVEDRTVVLRPRAVQIGKESRGEVPSSFVTCTGPKVTDFREIGNNFQVLRYVIQPSHPSLQQSQGGRYRCVVIAM